MLKPILTCAALALPSLALADTVSGNYRTEANEDGAFLVVKFGPCPQNGAQSCGIISKAVGPDGKSISGYEHIGKPIVWGMQDRGNGKWGKGKIWAPDTNKTYASKMERKGANLKVSGCVAIICRAQTWTPVK